MTPLMRFIMESALTVSIVSVGIWVGNVSSDNKAHAAAIIELQTEQKVLSRDLVETQKTMIKDLTEIKTILKHQK